MTDDSVSQQRRPRSEGQLIDQPATRQPSSPLRRPNTTPKLRIQRVLSQSASPPKVASGSGELFCMTKLSDSPPKPALLGQDDDACNGGNNANNDDTCATSRENEEDEPNVNASPPSTSRPEPDQEDAVEGQLVADAAHLHNHSRSQLAEAEAPPELSTTPPKSPMASRLEHTMSEIAPEAATDEERPTSGGGGSMYAQWRDQMDSAQAARDKMQNDLTEYLASLSTKQDDAGSALVTFPDNYDSVLKLMTKADLAPAAPTWSKALLQDGLTKKQAHGVIPGEAADAPTDLNIKIAHGIAQIRQLDAKLDDLDLKLNKPTKTKQFLTTPTAPVKKTTSAQRIKDKVEAAKTLGDGPDFISRNKEMKEAGTSLTKTEACRLEALLQSGELADDGDATAANPFDATCHDRVDVIEESLKEMQAKRATTPADGLATFGSVTSAPLLAFMPSMAHLDTTQRLAAIDCALQSFRDEDAMSAMGGDLDDDAKSVRSEVSRSSSVWSRASTRTVSKRDIQTIAAQAKLEVPDAEKAPREAINQLLATLSGITIELADDDDEDQPQVDDVGASQPHKPADEPAPMSGGALPAALPRRKRPTKPATAQPPPTSSSFSHLFTLPFEPAGPSRKQVPHTNHR